MKITAYKEEQFCSMNNKLEKRKEKNSHSFNGPFLWFNKTIKQTFTLNTNQVYKETALPLLKKKN